MKLSVLTCGYSKRLSTSLPVVFGELYRQMGDNPECELICLLDNERISIGEKVNIMVESARGEYVSIVSDDDMVTEDYVASLLEATESKATVILFDCEYIVRGETRGVIKEGKGWDERKDSGVVLYRNPSDKMCWRRDFRLKHPCDPTWETSDTRFARSSNDDIETEHRIDRILYFFQYNTEVDSGAKRLREKMDRERGHWRRGSDDGYVGYPSRGRRGGFVADMEW